MKRFLTPLVLLMLLATVPVFAQDNNNLITLNDATPAIDVVITLPPETTGTVSLEMVQVDITMADSANVVVFHAADPRLHAVELNIAPNSGSHTLTVKRLPGVSEGYVSIISLPELSINGAVERVAGSVVTLNEEIALSLDPATPGGMATLNIPADTTGVVTATFPGANATTQLVDTQGVIITESTGGHVDGLNLVLDAGNYEFTVLGSNLTETVVAGLRAVSLEDTAITIVEAPPTAENVMVADEACSAIVTSSSVNLRTGPGTGYSVNGYAYLDESYPVGGRNPENNWIVVGTDSGSAWMTITGVNLQGACGALTVFNIPFRDAPIAPIIITTPSNPVTNTNNSGQSEHEDHEDGEHENREHEEGDDD